MLRLVEEIAASRYRAVLFGDHTSPYHPRRSELDLCRTSTLVKRHQMLAISFDPAEDWFLFEYYEAAYEPKPWATSFAQVRRPRQAGLGAHQAVALVHKSRGRLTAVPRRGDCSIAFAASK